jgi:branched-chain amino acid transport system substrate-binding protein
VLGGDSLDSPHLAKEAGPDAGRIFYTTHADISASSGDPDMTAFISRYEKKYHETPNAFAALGYDTVNIVAEAIRASPSSTDLRAGLWSVNRYNGLTGTISYAGHSQVPQKSVTLLELRNGTPVSHGERIPQEVPAP